VIVNSQVHDGQLQILLWTFMVSLRFVAVKLFQALFTLSPNPLFLLSKKFMKNYSEYDNASQTKLSKRWILDFGLHKVLPFLLPFFTHTTSFTFWKGSTLIIRKKWTWKLN